MNLPFPADKRKEPSVKCVVVGDAAVGKTSLIQSYLENRFNHEHVPTASDIYNGKCGAPGLFNKSLPFGIRPSSFF